MSFFNCSVSEAIHSRIMSDNILFWDICKKHIWRTGQLVLHWCCYILRCYNGYWLLFQFFLVKLIKYLYFILVVWLILYYHYWWNKDDHKFGTNTIWEGNLRSGIALAMHHRRCGLSTYGLNGQRQGDEQSCICPLGCGSIYLIPQYWQSSFLLCIVTVQGIAYIPFKYLYTSMVAPLSPIYKRWQVHNFPAFIIWHVVQATSYFNGTSLNKL